LKEKVKVLIIEDESIPAEYLKSIIESEDSYEVVDIVSNANDALQSVKKYKPDIIFVDIMIKGGLSGAEFALKIHTLYENIILIFLTAYSEDEMIEYATESNAFAYLLKPYRPNEIKATLSLAKAKLEESELSVKENRNIVNLIDNYIFNIEENSLYKNSEKVPLSVKETELLSLLCKNKEITVSRETIQNYMNISSSSLRSLVYRIRKNIHENIIKNSKKFGYKIELKEK